jgi:hypothetical protein
MAPEGWCVAPTMGLTTPETDRIVIPRPEPLEAPVRQPEAEPASPKPAPMEPAPLVGSAAAA